MSLKMKAVLGALLALLTIATSASAAPLLPAGAPVATDTSILDFVNQFRAQVNAGLQPLTLVEDPLAAKALQQAFADEKDSDAAPRYYRKLGGTLSIGYGYVSTWSRPADDSWAALLDPRARELAMAYVGGYPYVAVRLDPDAQWNKPLVFGANKTFDSEHLGATQGVWFPGSARSRFTVARRIGNSWTATRSARPVAVGVGAEGAYAMNLGNMGDMDVSGIYLAAGSTYRVGVPGGGTAEFSTSAWTPPNASFRFGSKMSSKYRNLFLRHVRRANSQARGYVAKVDGLLYISLATARQHYSMAGMLPAGGRPGQILMQRDHLQRLGAHTTLHELGHIVQELGIDEYSMQRFQAAFRRSPRWQKCFRHYSGFCTPIDEVWADQFAYWALGERKLSPGTGYGDPPLLSGKAFGRLMRTYWAYQLSNQY